jgi:SAM-dependent methyltransferase
MDMPIASISDRGTAMTTPPGWDDSYTATTPPPWDINRPQPAFVRLAEAGLLTGRLLDSGCGTGENTLLAAGAGADAVGVDVAPHAIERARAKAAERGVTARFEVGDVLDLGALGLTFDTVIDSGVFHVFDDENRARYVASLASVLRPGGACYLLCFSDRQPGDFGPRRVRQEELRAAFSAGWTVLDIEADTFAVNGDVVVLDGAGRMVGAGERPAGAGRPAGFDRPVAQAWRATIQRT